MILAPNILLPTTENIRDQKTNMYTKPAGRIFVKNEREDSSCVSLSPHLKNYIFAYLGAKNAVSNTRQWEKNWPGIDLHKSEW